MRVVIILITLVICINAQDYFISFAFIQKNGKIIYDKFNCSKPLTTKYSKSTFLFSLPLVKDIKTTCIYYKDKIIDFLLKDDIYLKKKKKMYKNYLKSRIKLTFLPKRFDIIIKNGEVKFYLKE